MSLAASRLAKRAQLAFTGPTQKLPILPFDENRLNAVELVPFKAGIAAGAKAVMTAHLALLKIDLVKRPATLSPPVITGLLRNQLGFQGIVVTDGMTMQVVTDHYSADEAAVPAIEAGADAIIDNNLLPLPAKSRVRIVTFTEEPNIEVGRELERVLRSHVGAVSLSRLSNESSREFIQQMTVQFQEADVVLLGVYLSIGA